MKETSTTDERALTTGEQRGWLLVTLSMLSIAAAFGLQRLQLVRGDPWYVAPSFHAEAQPQDVKVGCVNSLVYPGLGDLKSVICQSQLSSPYLEVPPSSQTPLFLLAHNAIGLVPISFFLVSVVFLFGICACLLCLYRHPHDGRRLISVLTICALPLFAAFERGNFFYLFAPLCLIYLYVWAWKSRGSRTNIWSSRFASEVSIGAALISLKPTMAPLLLIGLFRAPKYSLSVIVGTLSLAVGLNAIVGVIFYDLSGYVDVILSWRQKVDPFPWNLYSIHPSSARTITSALDVESAIPTRILNLLTLFAPAWITASVFARLFPSTRFRSPHHVPTQGAEASSSSDRDTHLEVGIILYVASIFAIVGTGAPYQAAIPITIVALSFTKGELSRYWRWQLAFLVLILLSSIGVYRSLISFSPPLASLLHLVTVLSVWLLPSLFCISASVSGVRAGHALGRQTR